MKSCPDIIGYQGLCNTGYQFWQCLSEVNHGDCYDIVTTMALICQSTSSITALVLLLFKCSNCLTTAGGLQGRQPSNPDYVEETGLEESRA